MRIFNTSGAGNWSGTAAGLAAAAGMTLIGASAAGQCGVDGLYGAAQIAPTGSLPTGVAAGDIDNDGNIDVVTADFFGDNTVSLLRGNGDGSVQAAEDLRLLPMGVIETVGPVQPAIGDLNGDGWADIVVGVQSPDLGGVGAAVFLNDGSGQFPSLPEFYSASSQLRDMELVDMTGDGIVDIVHADRDLSTVLISSGNGDGTFPEIPDIDVLITGGPVAAVVRDYNNDGSMDFATALVFSSELAVFLNDGSGNFSEASRFAADSPEDLQAGDFNNDGNVDLVSAFLNGGEAQVFLGNGDGTFGPKIPVPTGAGTLPFSVAVTDADGDGFDDVHATLFLAGEVFVALSNGDGTFGAGFGYPVTDFARPMTLGDFDNDGVDDVVIANGRSTGEIAVLLNDCIGGGDPCLADTNGDGVATPADFNAWILAFNNQAPECDQNSDGLCTPADFNAWILNFNAGCN